MNKAHFHCPRCGSTLVIHQRERWMIHCCSDCGGVWLDPEPYAALVVALQKGLPLQSKEAMIQVADQSAISDDFLTDNTAPVNCRICKQEMQRQTIPHALVEVDCCPAHGIWFDRHELREVLLTVSYPQAKKLSPRLGRTISAGAAAAGAAIPSAAMIQGAISEPYTQQIQQAADNIALAADVLSATPDVIETVAEVGSEMADGADLLEVGATLLEGLFDILCALGDW